MKQITLDESTLLVIPGNLEHTLRYCVQDLIQLAKKAIAHHGAFYLALFGGTTAKILYQYLSTPPHMNKIDWSRVLLFWSDERNVPPHHSESNFRIAMQVGGLAKLPLKQEHIFRMPVEGNLELNAQNYEITILKTLHHKPFDCVMLGLGHDGHIASLFPETTALEEKERLIISYYVSQLSTWRMTMTYRCINEALKTRIYVFGRDKESIVQKVFSKKEFYPAHGVGTPLHPVTWILDHEAAHLLQLS